jgi:hypothetical protein
MPAWSNFFPGTLSDEQKAARLDECAAANYRAGAGRLTREQARAQCSADMYPVFRMNDEDAHARSLVMFAGVLGFGLFALVVRR